MIRPLAGSSLAPLKFSILPSPVSALVLVDRLVVVDRVIPSLITMEVDLVGNGLSGWG